MLPPRLGLAENWRQFSLLVLVSAFVGAMVGLERTVLPIIVSEELGLALKSAALSFIAAFGFTKALTNLAVGDLANRFGRRNTLIAGWLIALPVPLVIMFAPSLAWILFANALLGINQGLTWSTTVLMKIDLVGPRRRGLAMGLNEFAGYFAVALAALATGLVAESWGLRAGPAYLGIGVALAGLLTSFFFVRDTTAHALLEETQISDEVVTGRHTSIRHLLARSIWRDARLFSLCQAGFFNNLNDGLAWGIFPLLFLSAGLSIEQTGFLAAAYPAVWGIAQISTGALSDRWGRKPFIVIGMIVQGAALMAIAMWSGFDRWLTALVILGLGTALVYPTLLAAVGDAFRPSSRPAAVGVYRLWRDMGYVVGALLSGVLADTIGMRGAIGIVGMLTVASGLMIVLRLTSDR